MLTGCKCNGDKKGEQIKWDKVEGRAHCSSKPALAELLITEQRFEGGEKLAPWMSGRRAFQTEGKTRTEAQRQKCTWLTKDKQGYRNGWWGEGQ